MASRDVRQLLDRVQQLAHVWRSGKTADGERTSMANEFRNLLSELRADGWEGLLGWQNEPPDEFLPDWYIARRAERVDALEKDLARFAEGWGRSKDAPSVRRMYYEAYVEALEELFRIGHWSGEPDAESHLPYDLMPQVYKDFWKVKQGYWTV